WPIRRQQPATRPSLLLAPTRPPRGRAPPPPPPGRQQRSNPDLEALRAEKERLMELLSRQDREDKAREEEERRRRKQENLEAIRAEKERLKEEQWRLEQEMRQREAPTPHLPPFTPTSRGPGAAITLQALLEEEEAGMVQLGDASIASPFTARSTTIGPVEQILQQGRCTLATTMQMYKILALNCLISAYSLSVLYYDGIKLGDTQMTCVGVLVAMCFLFITRSKPLEKLSAQRPAGSIFAPGVVVSLLGQFAVLDLAHAAQGLENRASLDAQFTPNMVNTAVFLITSAMQVATFTINHRGRPFKEDLWENKGLLYGLSAMATLTLVAALESIPPFNTYLQLVPLPFKWTMVGYVVGDFVIAFVWDRVCLLVFRRA
ncbi:cation-transporting atpase 13a1 (g-box binding protein) family protein, partial [Acanthamoeba castellanii str. Neff]